MPSEQAWQLNAPLSGAIRPSGHREHAWLKRVLGSELLAKRWNVPGRHGVLREQTTHQKITLQHYSGK